MEETAVFPADQVVLARASRVPKTEPQLLKLLIIFPSNREIEDSETHDAQHHPLVPS
jgi:hypothetical protein